MKMKTSKTVHSREQFLQYFDKHLHGVLLIPETYCMIPVHCKYFVCIKPINLLDHFYEWLCENCNGAVRCFSSSETEEWWGFDDKQDVFFFLLRWA